MILVIDLQLDAPNSLSHGLTVIFSFGDLTGIQRLHLIFMIEEVLHCLMMIEIYGGWVRFVLEAVDRLIEVPKFIP
jgi:hypothetical protein